MTDNMKTARFVKKCDWGTGDARLYELSEPVEYDKPWDDDDPPAKKTKFVAVSATTVPFSGSETFIFPADENGKVIDWGRLDGSYSGGLSHIEALEGAGFQVVEGNNER